MDKPALSSFSLKLIGLVLLGGTVGSGCIQIKFRNHDRSLASDSTPAALHLQTWLENDLTDDLVLTARQNKIGSVYYAIYDANPGALTAEQIKTAATGALSGSLKANGTLSISTANVDVNTSIPNLADKVRYFVYAVGEDEIGLDADAHVKRYTNVLPTKQSMQTYATAVAGKGGITMRYAIQMPVGYYDDEASSGSWPLLIYMGGGGETFYDAANGEANFFAGRGMFGVPYFARVQAGVDDVPMIQATVQCNGSFWNCTNMQEPELYGEFIDQLIAAYRADPKRVYVVGMSWGGTGTWLLPQTSVASKIAAVAPLSGWSTWNTSHLCSGLVAGAGFAAADYKMPIWAFINQDDSIYPDDGVILNSIALVRACAGYTADARVTVFDTQAYPANQNDHRTTEYVLNAPHYDYTDNRWEYWDGIASVPDTNPPSRLTPLEPLFVSHLATASAELGTTLNSLVDWFLLWERP